MAAQPARRAAAASAPAQRHQPGASRAWLTAREWRDVRRACAVAAAVGARSVDIHGMRFFFCNMQGNLQQQEQQPRRQRPRAQRRGGSSVDDDEAGRHATAPPQQPGQQQQNSQQNLQQNLQQDLQQQQQQPTRQHEPAPEARRPAAAGGDDAARRPPNSAQRRSERRRRAWWQQRQQQQGGATMETESSEATDGANVETTGEPTPGGAAPEPRYDTPTLISDSIRQTSDSPTHVSDRHSDMSVR